MDAIFAYSRACREFEAGRNEVMEQMASLNESLDAYGREHPSIEKYSDVLVNSIGVAAMAGIVLAAPEVGLVATMGTAATTAAYGELFNCLIENGSDKFVEYCALLGRTEAESVRYGTAAAGIVGKLLKIAVIRGGLKSVGGKKGGTVRTMNTAEASARAKELFHAKAANENAVIAKVNQGIFDAVNKAPYNPRTAQNLASNLLGPGEFTRTTVPGQSMPNVRLAGQCKERIVGTDPFTFEPIIQRIVFDQRGFPIFDPYIKVETRISSPNLNLLSRKKHFQMATQNLYQDILSGKIDRNLFSQSEWLDIEHGRPKIGNYTWHHHQETGRMQLVPTDIHQWIGHIGGFEIWK